MRPGRQSPGIRVVPSTTDRAIVTASMRPGRQSPGITATWTYPSWSTSCFNEAGATKPRNSLAVEVNVRAMGASMRPGRQSPGILAARLVDRELVQASMRPGRQSPGIRPRRSRCRRRRRCFNEAGATKPRNSRRGPACPTPRPGASMRPGRQSPGIRGHGERPAPGDPASMRPGRQSPGIKPRSLMALTSLALQ